MRKPRMEISVEVLRDNVGITMQELAERLGCTLSHVAREYKRHPEIERPRLFHRGPRPATMEKTTVAKAIAGRKRYRPTTDCDRCRKLKTCQVAVSMGKWVECEDVLIDTNQQIF